LNNAPYPSNNDENNLTFHPMIVRDQERTNTWPIDFETVSKYMYNCAGSLHSQLSRVPVSVHCSSGEARPSHKLKLFDRFSTYALNFCRLLLRQNFNCHKDCRPKTRLNPKLIHVCGPSLFKADTVKNLPLPDLTHKPPLYNPRLRAGKTCLRGESDEWTVNPANNVLVERCKSTRGRSRCGCYRVRRRIAGDTGGVRTVVGRRNGPGRADGGDRLHPAMAKDALKCRTAGRTHFQAPSDQLTNVWNQHGNASLCTL